MENNEEHVWWRAPVEFLVESFVGTVIFAAIALPAVGLSFAVHHLENGDLDEVIVLGLKVAEYSLFFVDLVLFGRFLWTTACRTWRRL
jgi:hypothetical protein